MKALVWRRGLSWGEPWTTLQSILLTSSAPSGVPAPGREPSGEPGREYPVSCGVEDPHCGGEQPPLSAQGTLLPQQVTALHQVPQPTR